mmetsp:Transcript_106414/g.311125  ORF Transcript_106414/g.311125 Transcript_106414/m.311125 type:complete len:210 (+) Transcript_106414:375-1004(+)
MQGLGRDAAGGGLSPRARHRPSGPEARELPLREPCRGGAVEAHRLRLRGDVGPLHADADVLRVAELRQPRGAVPAGLHRQVRPVEPGRDSVCPALGLSSLPGPRAQHEASHQAGEGQLGRGRPGQPLEGPLARGPGLRPLPAAEGPGGEALRAEGDLPPLARARGGGGHLPADAGPALHAVAETLRGHAAAAACRAAAGGAELGSRGGC